MSRKKSMRIFWLSLCLLLAAGIAIIAAVQYKSHKKNEAGQLDDAPNAASLVKQERETKPQETGEAGRAFQSRPGTKAAREHAVPEPQVQPAGSSTTAEYQYELKETEGYLDVYYYHTQKMYFHTGIPYDTLTPSQKRELADGKYFQSEQELYGYLESCTS